MFKKKKTYLTDAEKQKLAEILAAEPAVELAYIYGSFATGLANKDSDVDVGVLVKPEYENTVDFSFECSLALKLEQAIGRDIDLRVINKAPVFAQYQVIYPNELLFAANDQTRVNFETYVISRYLDMKYYWDLYDKYRSLRLKRGEFGAGFERDKGAS
ncbi:Nucleotidyltransferase domain protein [Thermincola ferriacetica]|uniref:Nucleotidyltransferase domain protein n=1 Tax=Thermincola ferriacetica TaxID=281456 RepID=A0A0L6W5H6_9FIRM|nr:nucleotidyltransferase domain-containing protein [Thermincola ferriacetica]KNZ70623.1 Nucleotidyltransferase domain protein [Thermincola ferriacetica]